MVAVGVDRPGCNSGGNVNRALRPRVLTRGSARRQADGGAIVVFAELSPGASAEVGVLHSVGPVVVYSVHIGRVTAVIRHVVEHCGCNCSAGGNGSAVAVKEAFETQQRDFVRAAIPENSIFGAVGTGAHLDVGIHGARVAVSPLLKCDGLGLVIPIGKAATHIV